MILTTYNKILCLLHLFFCAIMTSGLENVPQSVLSDLEEYKLALQDAAYEVLQQYSTSESAYYDRPKPFDPPEDFIHSFRPGTGIGNREDLVIESIGELPLFDDAMFSKWRYRRFKSLDYVMAFDEAKVVIWKKTLNVSEPMDFSYDEGIFKYNAGTAGPVLDAFMFIESKGNNDGLFVGILTENKSSYVSIYEILDNGISMVRMVTLPFKTFLPNHDSANKLAFLESRRGSSLVILVSNVNQDKLVYRQNGGVTENNYIEAHFPSSIDMVAFAVGGNGYLAMANRTICDIYKMDEFGQNPLLFERIYFDKDIVDLEHFRLGFSSYLVVSAKDHQVLYVWKPGGFFQYQEFSRSNVQQTYGVSLPNCRDDIILLFVRPGLSPDFHIWDGQREQFIRADEIDTTEFSPLPGSIMSFSYGSTAYLLYVNTDGSSKLSSIHTHLNPVPDPAIVLGNEISNLMQQIQATLENQEETIKAMSATLENAVRPEGDQTFLTTQVFNDIRSTRESVADIIINSNMAWEGSKLTLDDYRAGTENIEADISKLEKELDRIEDLLSDVVRVDEDAVISGTKNFLGEVQGPFLSTYSLDLKMVGDIDLVKLQKDIYRLDKPSVIKGDLRFEKPLSILGHLNVGTVNGIDISEEVMTTDGDQVSNAEMTFRNRLVVHGNLDILGTVNGIDIENEVVTLQGNHTITGFKNFQDGIIAESVSADFVDDVDVNRLFNQALTINGDQIITGTKHFTGSLHTRDIDLHGTINGYNLEKLIEDIVRIDVPAVITGHKKFVDDVYINGALEVDGTIDGLRIPDDLFLVDRTNVVTGHKEFTGTVRAGNVTVLGTVNGLRIPSDIVTLTEDEFIDSTLHFVDGITVENDLTVSGLIDGVDITKLYEQSLRKDQLAAIDTVVFEGPLTITGNLDVRGLINGVSFLDLVNDIVFKDEKNVVIEAKKKFTKITADVVKLNGRINGYLLDRDFMTVDGDQVIYGKKVFTEPVTFQDITTTTDVINGVNITSLYENRVSLSAEQELSGDLEFADHLIVQGNLTVHGTLGGLVFPGDFVLRSSKQKISNKVFKGKVRVGTMQVEGDVTVQESFGGLNLQEFVDQRVTLTTDQEIEGDIILGDVTADQVLIDGLINGIDIVEFADNVMSLTRDQTITAYKEFAGETEVLGSIATKEGINGIRLDDVNRRAFKVNGENVVTSTMTFVDDVEFERLEVFGLINGINLTELDQDSVKKQGLQHITGTTVFHKGFSVEGNIHASSVNGLYLPDDILTKNTNQVISGTYTFKDILVNGDIEIGGHLNGIDLSEVAPNLVKKGDDITIYSDVVFQAPVTVAEDIDVTGLVNGIDLKVLERSVMTHDNDQDLWGHKILRGNVTVHGDVDVVFVNDVHWQDFLSEVVRKDIPVRIAGRKTVFGNVEVKGDVYVTGMADFTTINGVNLKQFAEDVVLINEPANITGTKVFANPVEIIGDLNADLINNLDLKTDIVTLQCSGEPQFITGRKTFRNITVQGNIYVSGTVNGYKLDELVANTLSTRGDQVITGHKTFVRPVKFMKNVQASTVNNLVLHEELVTLDRPQVIKGDLVFADDIYVKGNLEIAGLLNGIDIQKLERDALYADKEQVIEGSFTIEHAIVNAPIFVDGKVNGINLNGFYRNVSNFFARKNSELQALERDADDQCQILKHLYSALEHSYYALDGFNYHQVINVSANEIYAVKPRDLTLLSTRNNRRSAEAWHYRWNSRVSRFDFHAGEDVQDINRNVFNFNGHDLILQFNLQTKSSSVVLDGFVLSSIAHGFSTGDVLFLGTSTIIAVLYPEKNVCEVHEIIAEDKLSVEPLGTVEIKGANSVVLFEMSGVLHMAISCNLSLRNAKVASKIFFWAKKGWRHIQSIFCPASNKVVHFTYYGYDYLVFTNAMPVYETKEPQSMQVYRNSGQSDSRFSLFQKVEFDKAEIVEFFEFGGASELYMVVGNATIVQIFLLEGESGFRTNYVLHGECIKAVKPMALGDDLYLIVGENSDYSSRQTIVYKAIARGFSVPKRKNPC